MDANLEALDLAIATYLLKRGYRSSANALQSEAPSTSLTGANQCDLGLIWRAHHQMALKEHVEDAERRQAVSNEAAKTNKWANHKLTSSAKALIESALSKKSPHSWTKDTSVTLMDRLLMAQEHKLPAGNPPQQTFRIPPQLAPKGAPLDQPLPLQTTPPSANAAISSMTLLSSLKNPNPAPTLPPSSLARVPSPFTLESAGIKTSSITSDELALFQKLRQQVNQRNSSASQKKSAGGNGPLASDSVLPPSSHSNEGRNSAGGGGIGLSATQAITLLMQRQPSLGRPASQGKAGDLSRGQNPQATSNAPPGGHASSAILNNYIEPYLHEAPMINLARAGSEGHAHSINGIERRHPSTGSSLPPPGANSNIKIEPSAVDSSDHEQKRMLMLLEQRQSLLRIQQQQRASQKDALVDMMTQGASSPELFGSHALAPILDVGAWRQVPQGFSHPNPPMAAAPFHPLLDEGFNVPSSFKPDAELQVSKTTLTSPRGSRAKETAANPTAGPNSGGAKSKKAGSGERQSGARKGRGSKWAAGSNSNGSPSSVSFMDGMGRGVDFPMASSHGPSPLGLVSEVDPSSLTDLDNLLKNQEYLSWLAQRQALATHPPPHYNPNLHPSSLNLGGTLQQQPYQPHQPHNLSHQMPPHGLITRLDQLDPVNTNAGVLRSSSTLHQEPATSPLLNANGKRRSSATGHGLLDEIEGLVGLDEVVGITRGESPLLGLDEKRFSNVGFLDI